MEAQQKMVRRRTSMMRSNMLCLAGVVVAMLQPTIPGWKAETIGDDIASVSYTHLDVYKRQSISRAVPGSGPATTCRWWRG